MIMHPRTKKDTATVKQPVRSI